MRRGKPLERKTPLARGTKPLARTAPLTASKPLTRTAPLARSAPPRTDTAKARAAKPPRPRRRPVDTGPTREQRDALIARDKGRCVRCGVRVGESVGYNDHHRQGRGMGGRQGDARAAANLPSNRLTLCGSGTTRCHGWVTEHPAEAERDGFVVRRGGGIDPARVPVRTWEGWKLYDADGGVTPCAAPPGQDARHTAQV